MRDKKYEIVCSLGKVVIVVANDVYIAIDKFRKDYPEQHIVEINDIR